MQRLSRSTESITLSLEQCSRTRKWYPTTTTTLFFFHALEKPRERNIRANRSDSRTTFRRSPLEGRPSKPCRSRKERRKEKAGSCSPIKRRHSLEGSVTRCRWFVVAQLFLIYLSTNSSSFSSDKLFGWREKKGFHC